MGTKAYIKIDFYILAKDKIANVNTDFDIIKKYKNTYINIDFDTEEPISTLNLTL